MIIAAYILFSYLLALAGYGFYHTVIRKRAGFVQRKHTLYTILTLSLVLPAFLLHHTPFFKTDAPHKIDKFHNQPVLNNNLLSCYREANTQEALCGCEEVQQLQYIEYKNDLFYNTLIQVKKPFFWLSVGIFSATLLLLFSRLVYLQFIIANSTHRKKYIDGVRYIFLLRKGNLSAASFRLKKRYIIWHPELDKLSKNEQEAIIQHEISHLKHLDTWEQIGLNLIQIVWFFNPAFYWIKKELSLLNEFIADTFALSKTGNTERYAHLLLKLKTHQQYGFVQGFKENPLKSRLLQILEPQPIQNFILPWFIITGLFVSTFGYSIAPFFNQKTLEFEEYCLLQDEFNHSGKTVFCKNCLFEEKNK